MADDLGGSVGPATLTPRPSILVKDDDTLDGLSLYRALARQHTGDPSNYLDVMNGVLDLYIRIWVNPAHPAHEQIRELDNLDCGRLKTFFNALACPDAVESERFDDVLGFIADALNIRICTWTSSGTGSDAALDFQCVSSIGRSRVPICHVLSVAAYHPVPQNNPNRVLHFDSLLEDESGTSLMDFLEAQKDAMDKESRGQVRCGMFNGLQLKKICWWWRTNQNQESFDQRPDGAYDSVRHLPTRKGMTANSHLERVNQICNEVV